MDFRNLFIFEVANNHQGSVEHGKRIIDAMADVAKRTGIRSGVKFQFRDLDTFIHPAFRGKKGVKHIDRFESTKLSKEQFEELVAYVHKKKLLRIATPFDEASVALCVDLGIEIIKIASCSALDWPLLGAVAAAKKPVIISTGGLSIADIDKLVSFFSHKQVPFAVLHCVGVYPTPDALLHLNVIPRLIRRYPGIAVGYSGHEAPDDIQVSVVAASKGATILERHVGVPTDTVTLNAYSMHPAQTEAWVKAVQRTWAMSGSLEKSISAEERESLRSLMRGVYARKAIRAGQTIGPDDVFFAMPLQEGQVTSGTFGSYRTKFVASRDYAVNGPIKEQAVTDPVQVARDVIHQAQGMLSEANIALDEEIEIELSHHYGMERFREVGAVIVNVCNREYCKKLIVMLPGQRHPRHRHELKEEMFELLSGDIAVELDGERIDMKPGDQLLIKRNSWHSFVTKHGAIFEEISTTHRRGDSYYEDAAISALDPMQRKTVIREGGTI